MPPQKTNRLLPALLIFALAVTRSLTAATLSFSSTAPTATSPSIANWVGAAYDANNVGGTGTNAAGAPNNGTANDASTYVGNSRGAQGETFLTGANATGYTLNAITVQTAGYTNNITGGNSANYTAWALSSTSASFLVRVLQVSGTNLIPVTAEPALDGGSGNPGTGSSANGPGTYLTFNLAYPVALQPNTQYAFDVGLASGGDYFEMLGIQGATSSGTNPYTHGTAYVSGANGWGNNTFTTYAGDRVFMVNMVSGTTPIVTSTSSFVHPGLLSTAADFGRMRTNVALGNQPWLSAYQALTSSWMCQTGGWNPSPQATITRSSSTNNTRILYNDIAVAYGSALAWEVSGDTRYADQAVKILNAWGYTFTSIQGDTNAELCNLYGYQFACVAEIMRTYPGWAAADFAQFQTMIYNVFYPEANDFVQRHNGTAFDHYWANWDLCAMDDIYAIGVLCDNPSLTTQAVNYFYNGVGNGCIDRTVNFIFPSYLGQGQEIGRDQGHASLDVASIATLCQMAWNQGTDLYGYENNRVLALSEYTAMYNLWYNVPFTPYASGSWLMTGPSSGSRGATGRPGWATIYNHYVNLKGLAAPYTGTIVAQNGPNWSFNGDEPGWDYLTASLPPIATGSNPSGLTALINGQHPQLSWWGSAYATSYNVQRSTTSGGPYTTIATGVTANTYTDTNPVAGGANYYVVTGSTSAGGVTGISNEAPAILGSPIYAHLPFSETSGTTTADSTGNGWNGTLQNGASFTSGTINGAVVGAVRLVGTSSQYVSLPQGIVTNFSDFSVSAWVYQNSVSTQARVFDFGSGDDSWGGVDVWGNDHWLAERYLYLSTQGGSGNVQFGISHSTDAGEEDVHGTSALPVGQWTHVMVTLSGSIGTLYVNGQAVGQNLSMPMSPMQFPANYPTTNNYIGRSQWRGDPYFNGTIADFRIYQGALSAGQAYTLATGQAPNSPAPAPATLAATGQQAGSIVLNWSPVAGATSYTVWESTTSGGPYTEAASLVSGTSYTVGSLTAGTTYYFVVDTANNDGDGTYSAQASATTTPAAPASLSGSGASFTQINLSWAASSGATGYNVWRSPVSGGPYTLVAAGVTGTNYSNTGLTSATIYYYVVSASNAAGQSSDSPEANAISEVHLSGTLIGTTGTANAFGGNAATTAAAAVDGDFTTYYDAAAASGDWVGLDLGTATVITEVSYAPRIGFESRMVGGVFQGSNDPTFQTGVATLYTITAAPSDGIYTDGYVSNSTAYRYVRYLGPTNGYCNVAEIAFWNPDSAPQVPAAPATLVGTSGSSTVTLSWTPSSLATSYNVKRSTSSGGETNIAVQVTGTTYTDTGLTNGAAYYYEVSAINAGGESTVSTEVSVVPLAPPATLVAMPGNGQASLVWSPTAGDGYNVERSGSSGGPYSTVASGVATTSYIDTSVTNGNTYYYVVVAESGSSVSVNSPQASVVPGSTGPAAYLKFDETSGTIAADSSGNGWNGTCWNNPAHVGGLIGNGLSLNGTNDNYLTLPYGVVSAFTNFTISAWVKLNSVTNWMRVFDFGTGTNTNMFLTAKSSDYNAVGFAITTSGGSGEQRINGTAPLASGTWTHVVVTLSGSTGTLYVNGVAVGSNTNMTLSPYSLGSTNLNYIGKSQYSGDPYLNGVVDELRIYGRALSATEIAGLASPPVAPTGVGAVAGNVQVALSWNAASSGTGYNIYRGTVSGGPYSAVAASVTGTTYTDLGVIDGATYYYVMTTVSGSGESPNSSEVSATPVGVPGAPAGLTATGSNAVVSLSWTASLGATSYNVLRSVTSGTGYLPVASGVTGTAYSDTSVTNGTTYYYVVSASNANGTSGYSAQASATPVAPPPAPTGLTATGSNAVVTVNWTAATGATSYNVLRSVTSGTGYTSLASGVTGTTYSDTAVTNGTTYYYVVSASNPGGTSANSAQASATPVAPPSAPTGLTASGSNAVVTLSWTAATGATSYNVQRSVTSGTGYTTIGAGVSGTTYSDTTVTNGTTYYYVVTASNPGGTSANSAQASATPVAPPAAPTGLTASGSSAAVSLSWTTSAGATSYNVLRSVTSGTGYTTVAGGVGGTTYSDTAVTNGTTYYYVVSASNPGGTSANSAQASVTPLAAPTGLIATGSNSVVALKWTASTGATSYNVQRSVTSGTGYATITSVSGTTYSDTAVTNGTTYYYVVSASNSSGMSANSAQASAVPLNPTSGVYLRFDETSGTTAADSTGGGWNGTLVNGPSFVAGRINNALGLTGSSSQYATLPTGVVAGLTNFTVAAWVKMNSFADWMRVFDFGTGTNVYMFLTPVDGTDGTSGYVRFAITTNGNGNEQRIYSTVALATGTWTHLAVTLSGSLGTLYVNGTSAGTNSAMTLNPSSLGATTNNYIGKSQFSGDPYLNGVVDEFHVYNYALTAAQVAQLASPPSAPTGVAVAPGNNQAVLTWNAATGATGYNAKRSITSGSGFATVASVTGTSDTDTGLLNGTPYYYVVTTVEGVAESANSAQVSTSPVGPPLAPTGLTATGSNAAVALSWTASSGATGYNVQRSTTSGTGYTTIASGIAALTYSDTAVTSGTLYYYVVSAVNAQGTSAISSQVVSTSLPSVPAGLAATGSNASVTLSWSAGTGAASYNVLRSVTSGSGYTIIASGVTALAYTDNSVSNGTPYYYVVSSVNAAGTSANSAEVLVVSGAASDTWSASPTSANWNLAGNWAGGVTPGTGATLTFGTSSTTSLNNNIGNLTVGSLLFNSTASAFTLSGSAVTLEGQISNLSANTETINFNMTLGNTVTVNAGAGNVALGGVIGDGGAGYGLVKTGTAALTLGGANTFSGGVVLDAGTVILGASTSGTVTSGPLGTGTLTMNGGTLQMNAMTLANNVVIPSGDSAIIDNQSNNGTLNGNFSGAGTLTLQNSSGNGLSEDINGSWVGFTGTLNYNASAGSGKNFNIFPPANFNLSNVAMVFSNSGNNSQSSFRPLGTTQLGSLAGTGGYIQLSGTLEIGNLNTSTSFGGVIQDSGTGTVMKTGTGTLTLSGSNTYSGGTIVNSGTLALLAGGNGTIIDNLTINSGATVNTGVTDALGYSSGHCVTNVYINGGTLNDGVSGNEGFLANFNLTGGVLTSTGGGQFNFNGGYGITSGSSSTTSLISAPLLGRSSTTALIIATAQGSTFSGIDLEVTGVVADSGGGITKTGAGTLLFAGVNTYTGPTTINGGALDVNGSLTASSAVAVNSGGTLGGSGTVGGAVTVAGGGALAPGSGGAGALSLTGSLTLNNGGNLNIELGVASGSAQLVLSGGLSVSGTTTINITALSGFGPGIYPLISATSSISASSFTLGSTPAGSICSLSASGGSLSLIVDPPAVPTGLTATGSNAAVALSWTASSEATGYNVQRSTTNGTGYTTIASDIAALTYSDTAVTSGTLYYYVISALNAGGTSANSSQVVSTSLPSAPTGLAATGSNAKVTLSWSAGTGAASYNVQRSVTSGSGYTTIASGVTALAYADNSVSNGTTYYYVVSASNPGGTSPNSAQAGGTPSAAIGGDETLSPAMEMSGTGASTNLAFTILSSVLGHTYQLQYTSNLVSGSWTNIGSPQAGTGSDLILDVTINPATAPAGFYRILIQRM